MWDHKIGEWVDNPDFNPNEITHLGIDGLVTTRRPQRKPKLLVPYIPERIDPPSFFHPI